MSKQRWGRMLAILALAGASTVFSAPQEPGEQPKRTPPDNTKVNKRDRRKAEPTADQARNNASDREVMRKIRRSIVSDKSLSSYAHNIKIISENGKVTLKGVVHSEAEKQAVAAKAAEVAGAGNVTDEITVKGDTDGSKKHGKTS